MEDFRFIYYKEYWYLSAFINTNEFIGETKAEEIEALLTDRIRNLNEMELKTSFEYLEKAPKAEENKRILADMAKNIIIECDWEPFFQNFPYTDESNPYTEDNKDLVYNTLGYFKFEVEYYKDEPDKKEQITPNLLQQIPYIVKEILKGFSKKKENQFLLLDPNSPIYIFAVSNKSKPMEVQWNDDNINKYKRSIGYWTELYSGQWEDYSDNLFERRTKKNLTNRSSELQYIHRNSGFIYMPEKSMETEFSYIDRTILEPTPQVRAVLFALMTINDSLDVLFMKRYSDVFMSLEKIEHKTKNLRFLRGMIQTKMSLIYNALDWNPREHKTRILTHLINQFRLEVVVKRINNKFKTLYDSMQELYTKRSEETQKNTQKAVTILNILFSAGFILEFTAALLIVFLITQETQPYPYRIIYLILTITLGTLALITIGYLIRGKLKSKESKYGHTVDAVITDDSNNVILIKRKYAPFQGKYALPGGFMKYDEEPEQAIIREVREETNLAVKVDKKIGVYDQKGRDPRGRIISNAFKCTLVKDISDMRGGDDAYSAIAIPIEKLPKMELAFDHKKILKDAGLLK